MEQIKLLAAHYRAPDKQDMSLDVKVTSCFEDLGKHKPAKATAFSDRVKSAEGNDAVHQEDSEGVFYWKRPFNGALRDCGAFSRNYWTASVRVSNDEKFGSKFTPTCKKKGDNHGADRRPDGANWSPNVVSLQPMKLSELGASIINMPSLVQGQAFSEVVPPLQCSAHRQHHRSTAAGYPAPPPSDWGYLAGQGGRGRTGWKRGAHSATMYTRYRSPEFALMYLELEPSSTSCVCVASNNSDSRKFR